MSTQFLLIDGYNVLFAVGLARKQYGPGQFEACRRRLLQGLADRIGEAQRRRTTIVFDAQEAPDGAPSEEVFAEMRVVFSVGTDADSVIEQMLLAHSSPRQVLVVSSDHRLQRAAARRHAQSIDSDRFWERSQGEPGHGGAGPTREESLKAGAVAVDPVEIERMVKELGAGKLSDDAEVAPGGASTTTGSRESGSSHYEREMMERGEEALREWDDGVSDGA